MKIFILLFALSFNAFSQEISPKLKEMIFDKIVQDIYFEDDGYSRMPKLEDLHFSVVDEFQIEITGTSFSDWDMKNIDYHCLAEIDSREMVPSEKDVRVSCRLEGENWPYAN